MRKVALILAAIAAVSHAADAKAKVKEIINVDCNAIDHPDFGKLSIQDRLKLMCANESDLNTTGCKCSNGKGGIEWKTKENAKSDWTP